MSYLAPIFVVICHNNNGQTIEENSLREENRGQNSLGDGALDCQSRTDLVVTRVTEQKSQ